MGLSLSGLRKKERLAVGIDLGGRYIKMATLAFSGDTFTIRKVLFFPVTPGAVLRGNVAQPDVVAQHLRSMLAGENFHQIPLIIGSGGNDVMMKVMNMERTDPDLLLEKIRKDEAGRGQPDSTVLAVGVLDPESKSPKMSCISAHARKDAILRRQKAFDEAGYHPNWVDADPVALCNAVLECREPGDEMSRILVHIGFHSSVLVAVEKGLPTLFRSLPLGIDRLHQEIEKSGSLGSNDAEEAIRSTQLNSLHGPLFARWIDDLSKQIQQSANVGARSPEQRNVLLSGGGGLIPGVPEAIRESLSSSVEVFNPLADRAKGDSINAEAIEQGALYSIAVGLALRGKEIA